MKLTKAKRDAIPDDEFALPGRRFPIEDADHAEAALMDSGSLPAPERAEVDRKAEAALDKHPTRIAIRKAAAKVRGAS
jgi:hypothetical protein